MADKGSIFKQRVEELQRELDADASKISLKEKCLPTVIIIGIAIPFVIWGALFFFATKIPFVSKQEGQKRVRQNSKVFYWTLGFTLLTWVGMYIWAWMIGYDIGGMICSINK
jgi:hypothetical protein